MKIKNKSFVWFVGYVVLVIGILAYIGINVVKVDPFFHFHAPKLTKYYYSLDNERSQNNGIVRNFTYDAMITGTSMTQNFKTSELDALFGTDSIKVTFSGGSYKEINQNMEIALASNPDLNMVVRGLDLLYFFDDKDTMRDDLGEFPTYLYDNSPFNDVKYIFNRNVVFDRVFPMMKKAHGSENTPGITSFDEYSNWTQLGDWKYGINSVASQETFQKKENTAFVHITEEQKAVVEGTINQNVVSLAAQYPDVDFYYFFTPYSAVWWKSMLDDGFIYRQIEAEKIAIELMLQYDNIKLYSFNLCTDITSDINNYKDPRHYGEWINSWILQQISKDEYRITRENYEKYLDDELALYTEFDYSLLNEQIDYENDMLAKVICEGNMSEVSSFTLTEPIIRLGELMNAEVETTEDGISNVICTGCLEREWDCVIPIEEYLFYTEYAGVGLEIDDVSNYNYLVFSGQKVRDHGQPTVVIYKKDGTVLKEFALAYYDIDNDVHQYIMDISEIEGEVILVFNGGYVDTSGSRESCYVFSNIVLY